MAKIQVKNWNDYCPQQLFLYGTYKEDGTPDFGLFCWFSYIWHGELGVMACIGGEKLTKENIHKRKVFSANLVTEALLPLADFLGNTHGRDPKKMSLDLDIEKGIGIDPDAAIGFQIFGHQQFVGTFGLRQFVEERGILGIFIQFFQLIEIVDPAVADPRGDQCG